MVNNSVPCHGLTYIDKGTTNFRPHAGWLIENEIQSLEALNNLCLSKYWKIEIQRHFISKIFSTAPLQTLFKSYLTESSKLLFFHSQRVTTKT